MEKLKTIKKVTIFSPCVGRENRGWKRQLCAVRKLTPSLVFSSSYPWYASQIELLTNNFCIYCTWQAKTQKVQQEKAASRILAGNQNIKGLEDKLQVGCSLPRGPLLADRVKQNKILLEKVKEKRVIVGRCMQRKALPQQDHNLVWEDILNLIQSNLSDTDTEGTGQSVRIREVSVVYRSWILRHFKGSIGGIKCSLSQNWPKPVSLSVWKSAWILQKTQLSAKIVVQVKMSRRKEVEKGKQQLESLQRIRSLDDEWQWHVDI